MDWQHGYSNSASDWLADDFCEYCNFHQKILKTFHCVAVVTCYCTVVVYYKTNTVWIFSVLILLFLHLGCWNFDKLKNTRLRFVFLLWFLKVLKHPACKNKRIMHRNPYGIPFFHTLRCPNHWQQTLLSKYCILLHIYVSKCQMILLSHIM